MDEGEEMVRIRLTKEPKVALEYQPDVVEVNSIIGQDQIREGRARLRSGLVPPKG
jgi:hypothetical protein